jgi:DNA-binding response OmpR family regulator
MLPSVILGRFQESKVRSLSEERTDALVVSTTTRWVGYRGNMCYLSAATKRMLVALFSNPGRIVAKNELDEVCYGDDEDGGPDNMRASQVSNRNTVSFVCTMVGAKLQSGSGGYFIQEIA